MWDPVYIHTYIHNTQIVQACFEGAGMWDPVKAEFTGEPDWNAISANLEALLVRLYGVNACIYVYICMYLCVYMYAFMCIYVCILLMR